MAIIKTYPDRESLAAATAEQFVNLAKNSLDNDIQFSAVLSGGSTPQPTYRRITTSKSAQDLDWQKIHIFWGDERCVSPDHPESNYRMTKEAFLDHIPIPQVNVHRIRGEIQPPKAAKEYEVLLREFFANRAPRFDLIFLGMGSDGHTASLFPNTSAVHESKRWVVANYVDAQFPWRITITPSIINQALNVTFIVAGPGKAERLRQVLWGRHQPDSLPAQAVRPHHGQLNWMIDQDAASLLSPSPND
jgi:6-phosphogluconolactonase